MMEHAGLPFWAWLQCTSFYAVGLSSFFSRVHSMRSREVTADGQDRNLSNDCGGRIRFDLPYCDQAGGLEQTSAGVFQQIHGPLALDVLFSYFLYYSYCFAAALTKLRNGE